MKTAWLKANLAFALVGFAWPALSAESPNRFEVAFNVSLPVVFTSNALETPTDPRFDTYFDPQFLLSVSHPIWDGAKWFFQLNTESQIYDQYPEAGSHVLSASIGLSQKIGDWTATAKYRETGIFDQPIENHLAEYHDLVMSASRNFQMNKTVSMNVAGAAIRRFTDNQTDRTIFRVQATPTWTRGAWSASVSAVAIYSIFDDGGPAPQDLYLSLGLGAAYEVTEHWSLALNLTGVKAVSNDPTREFEELTLAPSIDLKF